MFNHEEDERFMLIMAALAEASGQEASVLKIKIYAKALEDIAMEDIEKAAWHIIRTRTTATFPKIAEIRQAVFGNPEDQAILALEKTEKAMREVGAYQTVIFDDPIIHAVISGFEGGWPGICHMTFDEWKFSRRDFVKIYMAKMRNPGGKVPVKLVGIEEGDNGDKGIEYTKAPVTIGDRQKILEWIRTQEPRKAIDTEIPDSKQIEQSKVIDITSKIGKKL